MLGDIVVGCDYELCKKDFENGVYVEGVDEDGNYHVDEYMRATLIEPEWLEQALTEAHQTGIDEAYKNVWREAKKLIDDPSEAIYIEEIHEMLKALQDNK